MPVKNSSDTVWNPADLKCANYPPICTRSSKWSLSVRFLTSLHAFLTSPMHITFPAHLSIFRTASNVWWRIKTINFLFCKLCLAALYFVLWPNNFLSILFSDTLNVKNSGQSQGSTQPQFNGRVLPWGNRLFDNGNLYARCVL